VSEVNRLSGDTRFKAQIDPDIADLVPGFMENRQRDVLKATEALEKKDLAALAMLGHTMKGAGAGYGFDEISVIGGDMETAAKQGDCGTIQLTIDRLAYYLEHVEIQYE